MATRIAGSSAYPSGTASLPPARTDVRPRDAPAWHVSQPSAGLTRCICAEQRLSAVSSIGLGPLYKQLVPVNPGNIGRDSSCTWPRCVLPLVDARRSSVATSAHATSRSSQLQDTPLGDDPPTAGPSGRSSVPPAGGGAALLSQVRAATSVRALRRLVNTHGPALGGGHVAALLEQLTELVLAAPHGDDEELRREAQRLLGSWQQRQQLRTQLLQQQAAAAAVEVATQAGWDGSLDTARGLGEFGDGVPWGTSVPFAPAPAGTSGSNGASASGAGTSSGSVSSSGSGASSSSSSSVSRGNIGAGAGSTLQRGRLAFGGGGGGGRPGSATQQVREQRQPAARTALRQLQPPQWRGRPGRRASRSGSSTPGRVVQAAAPPPRPLFALDGDDSASAGPRASSVAGSSRSTPPASGLAGSLPEVARARGEVAGGARASVDGGGRPSASRASSLSASPTSSLSSSPASSLSSSPTSSLSSVDGGPEGLLDNRTMELRRQRMRWQQQQRRRAAEDGLGPADADATVVAAAGEVEAARVAEASAASAAWNKQQQQVRGLLVRTLELLRRSLPVLSAEQVVRVLVCLARLRYTHPSLLPQLVLRACGGGGAGGTSGGGIPAGRFTPDTLVELCCALAAAGAHPPPAGLASLSASFERLLPRLPPHQLVAAGASLAALGWTPSEPEVMELWAARVADGLQALSPAGLAAALRALADARHVPDDAFLLAYFAASRRALAGMEAADLVGCLSALGRLGRRPDDPWLRAFYAAARPGAALGGGGVPPATWAALLSGLADLQLRPDGVWLRDTYGACAAALPKLSSRELSSTAAAAAAIGMQPPEAWTRELLLASFWQLPYAGAAELAELGTSLAALRAAPGAAWLREFEGRSGALIRAGGVSGEQLAALAAAMSRLRHRPAPSWLSAFEAASHARLGTLAAPDLAASARALAEMGARPAPSWLYSFVLALYRHMDAFSSPQLAEVFDALPKLAHSARWVDELAQICSMEIGGVAAAARAREQRAQAQQQQQAQPLATVTAAPPAAAAAAPAALQPPPLQQQPPLAWASAPAPPPKACGLPRSWADGGARGCGMMQRWGAAARASPACVPQPGPA